MIRHFLEDLAAITALAAFTGALLTWAGFIEGMIR